MTIGDLAALTAPVSEADPCGPDLDLSGDPEYMNYMARGEGLLPAAFYSGPDGQPFDRTAIDFAAEFEGAKPFLAQTRDIRLLALLAKLFILNRELGGFVTCIQAIAALIENQWDGVHPRGEGDDFGMRLAVIETLDDTAPVILPLQHVPLVQSRRSGPVNYRHLMVAAGEVQPREGEDKLDQLVLDRAFMETELETLIAQRGQFEALQTALNTICARCNEKVAGDQSVSLEKITAITVKIFDVLNNAVAQRDPSAAIAKEAQETQTANEGPTPAPSSIPVGAIKCNADVVVALDTLNRYFCRFEPSNPALLLVRQAQQLMGKTFLEVMQILVPDQLGQARFQIGKDRPFEIPIERLSSFASIDHEQSFESTEQEQSLAPGEEEQTPPSEGAPSEAADGEVNGEQVLADEPPPQNGQAAGRVNLKVGSRREAFALLEQIGVYYRVAEPSSPIAFITDRARTFADRDFAALLKDVLPIAETN